MSDRDNLIADYNALILEREGNDFAPKIAVAITTTQLHKQCYAFKWRVKPQDKLIEKVNRKKQEKTWYDFHHITDVIGVRFITLFRVEMPDVLDSIVGHAK
jgi:ppGpp synthetase/RelA/SpoT-type nucleotidyltranferase